MKDPKTNFMRVFAQKSSDLTARPGVSNQNAPAQGGNIAQSGSQKQQAA